MLTPRQRAKLAGRPFYNSGRPCPKGHMAKRRTTTTQCTACVEAGRVAHRILTKSWREANKERHLSISKTNHQKHRSDVINAYGGKYDCCGDANLEFLCLDHIDGGGNKHRKAEGANGLYRRLKREGYPKGEYRILCHNCNFSLGAYGYCPHQRLKLECVETT